MSYIDWRRVGFLIPDTRFTPANEVTADAVGDEASPRAGGIAEPDSSTARLVIEATGDQDTDLVLQVEQGGFPQLGAGARYSYRTSAEASTARRGWNAPNLITGWTAADYSTTANTMVCALGMANGQVLVAYRNGSTTAYFQTYTPDTNTWSGTIAFPTTVHATGGIALAQTPEGYVVVMFRESVDGQWRIYRYSVVDAVSGGSWVLHAADMLESVPSDAATRTRLFIQPTGEWVFFYGYANVLRQYASNSQGGFFKLVTTATPAASTLFDAVLTPNGKILVVIFDGSVYPVAYPIGSAYTPYTSVTGVTIASFAILEAWLVADPIGRVHAYVRQSTDPDDVQWYYTDDDGATWQSSNHDPLGNGDADTYITNGQAVHAGGAVWLCHQFSDPTATQDASVCLMKLGGWSSITIGTSGFAEDYWRYAPATTYIPIALPANMTGWTVSSSGTNAATLTGGRLKIACTGAGGTHYATGAAAITNGAAVLCMFTANVEIGGSASDLQAGCEIRIAEATGALDYRVGVYLTTTSFVVRDRHAGTALATITRAMTADTDFFVYINPGVHFFVAYKVPEASTWTEAWEGGATTSAGASANYARFGCSNSSVTTAYYRFWWPLSVFGSATTNIFAASTNATYPNIIGRLLTARAASIDKRSAYGRKQTYIRGKDGPGRVTETFQARTRSEFARENVMWQQAPSPRTVYKSTSYVTGQAMAWQPAAGVNTSLGSKTIAMAVLNTNAPVHKLWGDPDDGGGYDLLGTLTLFTGFGALTFIRTGNVIRINGGDAGSRFVMENEFVGASINLAGTKARRIDRNTSGVWNTTGRQVEIVIATSGEGAYDGTEASSGTCWIYAHSGVVVIPGVSNDYKKFMWEATGGESVTDTAYRTGKVLIGGVMVMGQQWDWGYTSEFAVPVVDTETRPGVTRRSAIGPSARTWGVSWTEGVDQIQIRQASTTSTPDFLASDSMGTYPEATRGDVPFLLAGLLAQTRGGEVPVVVLPKLPTAETSITDPTLFLYGRMGPEVRIENVQGSEGEDEVDRVPTITVKEIT